MKIATYNVNSIRAREARFIEWLEQSKPDIVCMQELKVEDEKFPELVFQGMGYTSAVYGQKTYNGVAILSRGKMSEIARGLGDDEGDDQARFISVRTFDLTVVSVYVPNGESLQSEKYPYKIRFFERLTKLLGPRIAAGEKIVVAGDYNVAPDDIDVHDPLAWKDSVLFSAGERAAFKKLIEIGLVDSVRHVHPTTQMFSWWDYRMLGFPKNRGLRIDHLLVTQNLISRVTGAGVDREARKGKLPSDHAPVWIELQDA